MGAVGEKMGERLERRGMGGERREGRSLGGERRG